MKIIYDGKVYACSFSFALDMVSGKWKALMLWHLRDETLRYGEIRKKLEGITQKCSHKRLEIWKNTNLLQERCIL